MDQKERLRGKRRFASIYEHGRTWASDLVVLKLLPNDLGWNRYAFVAGKYLGKAVVRNRVKRLLREVVRTIPTNAGWDMVLIARSRAATSNYHELKETVLRLLRRARILKDTDATQRTET